jgi:putative tricarboxylic transport membrane protein
MNPKTDVINASIALVLSVLLWFLIPSQVMESPMASGMGPEYFPYTMTIALGIFSLILLIKSSFLWLKKLREGENLRPTALFLNLRRFLFVLVNFFLYYLLMGIIGFELSTFLFLVIGAFFLGARKWWQIALFASILDLSVTYSFRWVLGVVLP